MVRDLDDSDCAPRTVLEPDASQLPDETWRTVRQLIEEDMAADASPDTPVRTVAPDLPGKLAANAGPRLAGPDIEETATEGGLVRRFLRRPDAPRWIAAGFLLAVFLNDPWFLVWLFVIAALFVTVIWFSIGPDRSQDLILAWYARLRTRDPEKAERIRHRAATASKRLDAFLGYLPDRWTTGLYLPDFESDTDMARQLNADPFDRLARDLTPQAPRALRNTP